MADRNADIIDQQMQRAKRLDGGGTAPRQASSSRTSVAKASARPPSARIISAVWAADSSARSTTITAAPSRAAMIAMARPLPIATASSSLGGPSAPPPKSNRTLPFKRPMMTSKADDSAAVSAPTQRSGANQFIALARLRTD
jgi:hypothetical protein